MKKFKARVVKKDKKVNLIVARETLEEAKAYLKKQGYAVIEVNEVKEGEGKENEGEQFFFEAKIGDKTRKGKIYSEDMFKAYIKLVDELEYKVVAIYKDEDTEERVKKLNTSSLERSYKLFRQEQKKKIRQKTVTKKTKKQFYAQKKVEKLHIVIKEVEVYVKKYIKNTEETVQVRDLYNIIPEIKKIASSSNMDKIKNVLQKALMIIGEKQIDFIRKNKIKDTKKFLKETNDLLKKAGIRKQIQLKEETASGQIQNIIKRLQTKQNTGEKIKKQAKKKAKREKDYTYYQAKQNIAIYTKKRKELERLVWKQLLQPKKRKKTILQIEAIQKNIFILSRRVGGSRIGSSFFSSKTVVQVFHLFVELFQVGVNILSGSLLLFSMYFLLFYSLIQTSGINTMQIFNVWSVNIALFLFVSSTVFTRVRSLLGFVFSTGVSILFYIFLQVNFF